MKTTLFNNPRKFKPFALAYAETITSKFLCPVTQKLQKLASAMFASLAISQEQTAGVVMGTLYEYSPSEIW